MDQQTLHRADLSKLREEHRRKVTEESPAAAADAGDWPIDEHYCFARVILDTLL